MENPETAQVRVRVCEGFTRPGPRCCSCTWERTPGTRRISPCQSPAVTTIPTPPCLTPETLTLGTCHQAEKKTQQPHLLLDHSSAFPRDLSPAWRESYGIPQPRSGFYPQSWRGICKWGSPVLISGEGLRSEFSGPSCFFSLSSLLWCGSHHPQVLVIYKIKT